MRKSKTSRDKRSRNDVARYMLEHRGEYRIRIIPNKKKREPKLNPRSIQLEDDDDE